MSIDSDSFRKLMSNFATGVTVVTTAVDGKLHGFTANAVASVSLDPLLCLVCVAKHANAHAELSRAHFFALNVLSEEQLEVSNTFAKSGPPQDGSLRGVAHHQGRTGAPLIDGCLAWVECAIHERLDAGDHTIVIGRVMAGRGGEKSPPLLFFRGSYRLLRD